jgi:hypothetical protein
MPFTRTWAETFDQHSLVANIVITSLALVGGVLLGADAVARFDPIYSSSTRRGRFHRLHESPIWLSLLLAGSSLSALSSRRLP